MHPSPYSRQPAGHHKAKWITRRVSPLAVPPLAALQRANRWGAELQTVRQTEPATVSAHRTHSRFQNLGHSPVWSVLVFVAVVPAATRAANAPTKRKPTALPTAAIGKARDRSASITLAGVRPTTTAAATTDSPAAVRHTPATQLPQSVRRPPPPSAEHRPQCPVSVEISTPTAAAEHARTSHASRHD